MTREEYIHLYEKCASGDATKGEKALLEEYKDDFSIDSVNWDATRLGNKLEVTSRIYEKLEKRIQNRPIRTLGRYLRPMAAAVVLFSLSLGLYFYLNNQEEVVNQQPATIVKVTPDHTKAFITLEDGSKVILDDTNIGFLANQGSTIITKEDKGKLKYDTSLVANDFVVKYNTISIPRGAEYQLVLPDGTKVWLNSESSLKFPTAFNGRERKVELSGEAYFEVAKNKEKPFHVLVKGMEIKVLGTHFNVNAFQSVKTTLVEGSVKLISQGTETLLKPGESGVMQAIGNFKIEPADVEAVTAWRNGYFVFRDESIKSIMEKVARRYDVDVEYRGDIESKEFYGKVSRYDDLSELLKNMELTGSVHFKIIPESSGKKRRIIVMQ